MLLESSLFEFWKTKVCSNQANTASRKRQLKNGKKALQRFICPCSTPPPHLMLVFRMVVPFPVWVPSLVLEGAELSLFVKNCFCSNLSRATWKIDIRCLCLFCLMWNLLRAEKCWAFFKNTEVSEQSAALWSKRLNWGIQYSTWWPGRKSWGEGSCRELAIQV